MKGYIMITLFLIGVMVVTTKYWPSHTMPVAEPSYEERAKSLFSGAIGPSPWYWRDRSLYEGLRWNGEQVSFSEVDRFIKLRNRSYFMLHVQEKPLMLVNWNQFFLPLADNKFLFWHKDSDRIHFYMIAVNDLEKISNIETHIQRIQKEKILYYSEKSVNPLFSLPLDGRAGSLLLPETGLFPKEIMFVLDVGRAGLANYRLFTLYPSEERYVVKELHWFNQEERDFGYEWPSAAVRDSETQQIFITGMRIPLVIMEPAGEKVIKQVELPYWGAIGAYFQ